MKVSGSSFKLSFGVLTAIFSVWFIIEFVFTASGNPLGEIYIAGLDLEQQTIGTYLLRSLIGSLFIGGIVNFFLTIKIIKEAKQLKHWPAPLVVLMTILFPLELIISMIAVVPNIIIFGILSRTRKDRPEHIRSVLTDMKKHDYTFESKNLDNILSQPIDDSEIYTEIVTNYRTLINELKIEKFSSFKFESYDNCRIIILDGKRYDLDDTFTHDDSIAAECLCAIDALIADANKDEISVLKEIEKRILP